MSTDYERLCALIARSCEGAHRADLGRDHDDRDAASGRVGLEQPLMGIQAEAVVTRACS